MKEKFYYSDIMKKIKLFFCLPEIWLFAVVIGFLTLFCHIFTADRPMTLDVSDWTEATIVAKENLSFCFCAKDSGVKLKLSNRQEIVVWSFDKFPDLRFLKNKQVGDKVCYRFNLEKPLGREFREN